MYINIFGAEKYNMLLYMYMDAKGKMKRKVAKNGVKTRKLGKYAKT